MLDLRRLEAIRLHRKPIAQRLFALGVLTPNFYNPLTRTRIRLEGRENLPAAGGAIFVMNHTDRYNYWPFQYQLWKEGLGFTATWVKGKYYENAAIGWFMDANNNIPIPSRGYVLTKDFEHATGRIPTDAEYAALKAHVDGKLDVAAVIESGGEAVAKFLSGHDYPQELGSRFSQMMARVTELNRQALALGLNLLVFPQGTRSRVLTPGHTGAAQMALHLGAPIIPVGCSGSDRCYPGTSPLSRGGEITYRIGKPLLPEGELRDLRIEEPFVPFTESAERHEPAFRKVTELMMSRINELVEPPYQFQQGASLQQGARRFV